MYEYALAPSLSVSFQRYPYPPAGLVTALPTSWGALPFVLSAPRQLILPCPDGEAFWIGLIPSPAGRRYRLRVLVSMASGDRVDALTGTPADDTRPPSVEDLPTPPRYGVPGIFRGDGSWWAFARDTGNAPAPACREIQLLCRFADTGKPIRQTNYPSRQHVGPGYPQPSADPHPPEAPPPYLESDDDTSSAQVDVVEPGYFQTCSGMRVPPLEENNRYGGWCLP